LAGALGAALASMAAKIALHKFGPGSAKHNLVAELAERAQAAKEKLLAAVDDDAAAYRAYLHALSLPAQSPDDQEIREQKIQEALKQAVEVPYRTAVASFEAMQLAHEIAEHGPPQLIADASVGCEIALVGVRGSVWNITANLESLQDQNYAQAMRDQCRALLEKAEHLHQTKCRS
jgi:formiminotetrahydrofolate cyclodeaminase